MPTISSASVRLATTATDTVAPSTISTPLLLLLPEGRYCIMVALWAARRTRGNPARNQSAVPAAELALGITETSRLFQPPRGTWQAGRPRTPHPLGSLHDTIAGCRRCRVA